MSKIEEIIFGMAQKIADGFGFEIADIEYKKEGSDYFLRVYIDKEEGYIGIDDCEKVSKELSDKLDEKDPIKEAYILEVCSPGLDRKLKRDKDFVRFMGSEVDVKVFKPIDGKKEFSGVLLAYDDGVATIECENNKYNIKKDEAVYIKLAVKF